jgi:hypothetical protein
MNAADRKAIKDFFARDREIDVVYTDNPGMQKVRLQTK